MKKANFRLVLYILVIMAASIILFWTSLNLDIADATYVEKDFGPPPLLLRYSSRPAEIHERKINESIRVIPESLNTVPVKMITGTEIKAPRVRMEGSDVGVKLNKYGRSDQTIDLSSNVGESDIGIENDSTVSGAAGVSVFGKINFLHKEWLDEERNVVKHNATLAWIENNARVQESENDTHFVDDTVAISNQEKSNTSGERLSNVYNDSTQIHVASSWNREDIGAIGDGVDIKYANDGGKDATGDLLFRKEALVYRQHIYNKYYRRIRNQVNCSRIMEGDREAIQLAEDIMPLNITVGIPTEKYARIINCNNFRRKRGYIEDPLSDAERDFPIAFALIVYKDIEQVERLLRAIYRPHNHYCIHVDVKAKPLERKALEHIAGCFDNVFLATRSINVTWGEFSVLETELICMGDLIHKRNWKYYINLTGQEFPLKTNREIVKILEALGGDNVVEIEKVRAMQRYFYRWTKSERPPPHNIRPIKGAVHVAINRQFVEFCLNDNRAQDFLQWLKRTEIPDETFFASMNYNAHLKAPGGDSTEHAPPRMATFMRFKNWKPSGTSSDAPVISCSGKYVRNICILGVGDLHKAFGSLGLFVNKFHLDFEHLAFDCLEEVLLEKTWLEYLDDVQMYVKMYKTPGRLKYRIIR